MKTEEQKERRRAYMASFDASYRAANRDKIAAKRAAYRAANRDKIAAREAGYRAANRDKIAAKRAAYRAANRDKNIASCSAYYAANRDLCIAAARAYQAAHPLTEQQKQKKKHDYHQRRQIRNQARLFAGVALLSNQIVPHGLSSGTDNRLPANRDADGRTQVAT